MELAKITSKGQITIPKEIRKKLGVKDGDKVLFVEEEGRIIMMNSSMQARSSCRVSPLSFLPLMISPSSFGRR